MPFALRAGVSGLRASSSPAMARGQPAADPRLCGEAAGAPERARLAGVVGEQGDLDAVVELELLEHARDVRLRGLALADAGVGDVADQPRDRGDRLRAPYPPPFDQAWTGARGAGACAGCGDRSRSSGVSRI